MIRIGILANTFEPVFEGAAGGHVHFIEIAKRWPDADVVVFAPREARATMSRVLPRARFVAMPGSDFGTGSSQIRNLSRVLFGLRRLRELRSCDALLATSHFLPDVVPGIVAKGRRTVVCVHHVLGEGSTGGPLHPAQRTSLAFQALSLAIVRTFGRIVVANHPDTLRPLGFSAPRIDVVRMRHGADHVAPAAARTPTSYEAIYLGRLVPTKNVEDALRAWARAVRRFPTARLALAGAGDATYVAMLRELARTLDLEGNVTFLGRVTDDEREALYAGAGMFVFPTLEEGWGIVLAEAMAHGVPCVTYDLPAFRRDFTTGRIVVPLGDVTSFATAIEALLGDAELRRRLGAQARTLADAFRWESAARIELDAILRAAAS